MAFIKVAILIVSASLLMTAARAAPAADSQPQVVAQPGGAILVPVSRLAHTQIQGVPYVILSANAAQQFSPGRFFLRSAAVAGAPTVAFGPPGPAAFSFGPPAPSPVAFGPPAPSPVSFGPPAPAPGAVQAPQQTFVRIAQPAPAPAAVLSAPVPPPALAPAVLVRKEVVEPGRKLAVFRKPVAAAQEDSSNEKIVRGPPQPYSFSYQIHGETGDQKSASETSDGNTIVGSYSLVEPDGTLRVVKYQADPINGFTAQVERTAGAFPAIPDPVRKPENANDS